MRLLLLSVGLVCACSQSSTTGAKASKAEEEPAPKEVPSPTPVEVPSPTPTTDPAPPPASPVDAALPPAERRLEPMPGWNPSHATLRLLRKIGARDWKLAPFINAKRGVFVYREALWWEENKAISELYCPPLSPSQNKQLWDFFELVDMRLKDVTGTDMASCKNTPRPPVCSSDMAGEYESSLYFFFADADRGIELDAIFEIDMDYPASNAEVIGPRKLKRAKAAWKKARLSDCSQAPSSSSQ